MGGCCCQSAATSDDFEAVSAESVFAQSPSGKHQVPLLRAEDFVAEAVAITGPDHLVWLNSLVGVIWPRVLQAVDRLLAEQVKPQIRQRLPYVFRSSFDLSASFGDRPPTVGPVKVFRRAHPLRDTGPKLQVYLKDCPECDINLSLGVVSAGVRLVKLVGSCMVSLNPVQNEFPIIAGIDVYCPDAPRFELDFTGLANIADVPGLARIVRSSIESAVSEAIVLPHKFAARWTQTEPMSFDVVGSQSGMMLPIGVLRIRVVSCTDLQTKADWSFTGKTKLDPYVRVQVGNKVFECEITAEGQPEDINRDSDDFAIYDTTQQLQLDVYDADNFTSDDHIGYCTPMSIIEAIRQAKLPITLRKPGGQQEAASLTLELQWLQIIPGDLALREADEGFIVMVTLQKLILPRSWKLSAASLRVTFHEAVQQSSFLQQDSKGETEMAVQHAMQEVQRSLQQQGVSEAAIAKAVEPWNDDGPLVFQAAANLWFRVAEGELTGQMTFAIVDADGKEVSWSKAEMSEVKKAKDMVMQGPEMFCHITNSEQAKAEIGLHVCGLFLAHEMVDT